MQQLILANIDPDKNEYRFYRLVLPPGSLALLRQWGRLGDYIHEKWDVFTDRAATEKAFSAAEREKRREGYIDADKSVFPKNYMFYAPPDKTEEPGGQLSFLID